MGASLLLFQSCAYLIWADCSRLSSPGDGVRPCQATARVGARLSRPRPVQVRSQSAQLHPYRRARRPFSSPDRAQDARAIFIGTSCSGLLAMMLAASRPAGPVIEVEGWLRMKLRIK